ncbi:MAG: beta-lactamase family protein [Clostridium sp.]|nr:beta-lactamase family protein [Clostridium sp.]MCM1398740.1 beta-lactamase family protein [Clostridium sp.]MCM1458628.1 beta-lactamase family protein [Bacteroides sp.]
MSIQMDFKFIDFLFKYTSGKIDEMPLYQGNDVSEFMAAKESMDVTYASPNKKGVSAVAVKRLYDTLAADETIHLCSFGMMVDGEVIAEYYREPYKRNYRRVSFSMCKSIISMAVGIAEHEGLLSLNEKLADIFPAHDGVFFKRGMKEITIKNLLTMTSCVSFDEVGSVFAMDWRRAYMSSDISLVPASGFSYNSMNTYMLAAILVKRTGKSVMDYLTEKLFAFMDIYDITWDKCPMGIEKGGFGMKLSIVDMLKLGQLYLNDGAWMVNGEKKQLVPREWVGESTKMHVRLDRNNIAGYGYQIWLLTDGSFLYNGVFGQNVYVNRDRGIVIATTASACDIFPDGRIVKLLAEFAACDDNFKRDMINRSFYFKGSILDQYMKKLHDLAPNSAKRFRQYFGTHFGTEYKFDEYAGSILPISIQCMYSVYQTGIKSILLGFRHDSLYFKVCEDGIIYNIRLGYKKGEPYVYQLLEIKGKSFPIAAGAAVAFDEDDKPVLKIKIIYLEEVGIMSFKLMFEGSKLTLKTMELPRLYHVAGKLSKEEYIKKKNYKIPIRNILDTPDYMKYKLKKVLEPVVTGRADL